MNSQLLLATSALLLNTSSPVPEITAFHCSMNIQPFQATTDMPFKTISVPVMEHAPVPQSKSLLLMDNIDHNDMTFGAYILGDVCTENEMSQSCLCFNDSISSSLCLLPFTASMPFGYNFLQPQAPCIDVSKLNLLKLQQQQQQQQQQLILLQHWRLWNYQVGIPLLNQLKADSGITSQQQQEQQQQQQQQHERNILSQSIQLSQSTELAQDHHLQWSLLGGSIKAHIPVPRRLPVYSGHFAYRPSISDQLSSPEAASSMSGQGSLDISEEGPRQSPALVAYEENMYHDKLIVSAPTVRSVTAATVEQPCSSKQNHTSLSDSEPEERVISNKRKRVRSRVKSTASGKETPPLRLHCTYSDCRVICSSNPSLSRHIETHKWRGSYAPIRCEACQRSLSNEFSVQRHILNSKPTSRCHQMRVYSVMCSEMEVETTVRFYPKRAHGKKTVEIDLEYARTKYSEL